MHHLPDNASPLARADLAQRKLYVLMSNGHIHVWRMHDQRPPTLVAVWDKLTPNHKDLALCITLMPTGSLDPKLADLQGEQPPEILLLCPVNMYQCNRCKSHHYCAQITVLPFSSKTCHGS